MKINKRLINIAIISLLIALTFTFLAYKTMKKSVEPEKRERIAYFKYNISKGNKIKSEDLYLKNTPVSLIPKNAIRNIDEYKNKTLIVDVTSDDFALSTNFITRGETRVDVDDMYQLGIKVDSIDNFLGTQLKEGNYYGLLYIDSTGKSGHIFKVKLVNMVDGTGKIVIESGDGVVEEINIAVETHEEMRKIAEMKRLGSFELVKIPENKWEEVTKPLEDTDSEGETNKNKNQKENSN